MQRSVPASPSLHNVPIDQATDGELRRIIKAMPGTHRQHQAAYELSHRQKARREMPVPEQVKK